jgi:transposase
MRVDYVGAIAETEGELADRERQERGGRAEPRVRLLRLLRSGSVGSVRAAAPPLGYSQRQLQTWWKLYKTGGLEALTEEKPHPGKESRLTDEAYEALSGEMRAGMVATLRDAREYLSREWGVEYKSLNGVWLQLRRRGVKPKTGRRRHSKSDPKAREEYKRGLRRSSEA